MTPSASKAQDHITIALGDERYPELLRAIYDPPVVLYCDGVPEPGDRQAVAIVGSRQATPYGFRITETLAGELSALGFTIVSGFARGIDAAAHRAALAAGGRTIAVLGCGLDVDYPPGHASLRAEIAGSGAVLTEFDPGTPPRATNFPRRNRIISGLALGVVVVEAAEDSGSLITARLALEQGREVFAVRSEEHTSELQSRSDLVCRLLLEKKKKNEYIRHYSPVTTCYFGSYHIYIYSGSSEQRTTRASGQIESTRYTLRHFRKHLKVVCMA